MACRTKSLMTPRLSLQPTLLSCYRYFPLMKNVYLAQLSVYWIYLDLYDE